MNEAEMIQNAFMEQYKDKIESYKNIYDFFNSFTQNELISIVALAGLDNKELLSKSIIFKTQKKNKVVDFITDSYKMVYDTIIKHFELDELKELEKIFNLYDGDIIRIELFKNIEISFKLIIKLKMLNIARINFSKSKEELTLVIPKEIRNIILHNMNDKNFIKYIRRFCDLNKNAESILFAYGVISLNKLIEIIKKEFRETYNKDIKNDLIKISYINENINFVFYDNDYLVYNLSFENEDEAIEFYSSLDSNQEYKIYSKSQYEEFCDFDLTKKLESYKKLKLFLLNNFDMNNEDIEDFFMFIVDDYVYFYQIDKTCDKNLSNALKNNFDNLSVRDELIITNYIKEIAKHYPNYKLKGNCYINL